MTMGGSPNGDIEFWNVTWWIKLRILPPPVQLYRPTARSSHFAPTHHPKGSILTHSSPQTHLSFLFTTNNKTIQRELANDRQCQPLFRPLASCANEGPPGRRLALSPLFKVSDSPTGVQTDRRARRAVSKTAQTSF